MAALLMKMLPDTGHIAGNITGERLKLPAYPKKTDHFSSTAIAGVLTP